MQPERDGRPDHEAEWGVLQQRLARAYDGLPDLPSDVAGVTRAPARPPLPAGSSVAPVAIEAARPIRGLPARRRRRWDPLRWRWLASAAALATMGGLLAVGVFGRLAPILPPELTSVGRSVGQWLAAPQAVAPGEAQPSLLAPGHERGPMELPVITVVGRAAPGLRAATRPSAAIPVPSARASPRDESSASQRSVPPGARALGSLGVGPSDAPQPAPVDWQALETGRAVPGSEDVTYRPGHDRTVPPTDQQIPATRLEPDHAAHRGKLAVP
jgi:hypothetical protein